MVTWRPRRERQANDDISSAVFDSVLDLSCEFYGRINFEDARTGPHRNRIRAHPRAPAAAGLDWRMKMTADDKFHAHLDTCRQCCENCFDLCPVGVALLVEAAKGGGKVFRGLLQCNTIAGHPSGGKE